MPAADCQLVTASRLPTLPDCKRYKRGILYKLLRRTDEGWRRPRQHMQMAWQKVASFPSMAEDGVTGVNVDGVPIALYRLGDEIFATHGICTHALAFLSDGWVEDGKIECPLHQGQFDIRTGKALCSPVTEDLRVYPVKRDGDDILINLSEDTAATETAELPQPADLAAADPVVLSSEAAEIRPSSVEELTMNFNPTIPLVKRVWPNDDLSEIPDWIYTDQRIYDLEVERIFHGRTWNYVALEAEVPEPGHFIRSNVGPTPVIVARADDGSINVFENRCSHRAAEFCRELRGQTKEFVCPYHQWSYDLKGNLAGIPFRRGVNGKGGMPSDFKSADHGPRRLKVTTHRGVVFASYAEDIEDLADYF
jgi:phenylpropionate dioxygenase-like ring-hydroxylating dioxygenase large terminal subunit